MTDGDAFVDGVKEMMRNCNVDLLANFKYFLLIGIKNGYIIMHYIEHELFYLHGRHRASSDPMHKR